MTRDEIDKLWFQACKEARDAQEPFARYHFAMLIAAKAAEAALREVRDSVDETINAVGDL